jgi:hypothetical protein
MKNMKGMKLFVLDLDVVEMPCPKINHGFHGLHRKSISAAARSGRIRATWPKFRG